MTPMGWLGRKTSTQANQINFHIFQKTAEIVHKYDYFQKASLICWNVTVLENCLSVTFVRLCKYYPCFKNGCRYVLTLKTPRKPASENVVCLCRLLNILANFSSLFLHIGKQCGPRSDCSWSGSTLFAEMTFKVTSRRQSRRQLLWLAL